MKFKKSLIGLVLITSLVASATAIEVRDIQVNPNKPRLNDTVNVTADINSGNDYIQDVKLRVIENSNKIVNQNMKLLKGSRYDEAEFKEYQAFKVASNPSTYKITVTALASGGDTDTESLIMDVGTSKTELTYDPNKHEKTDKGLIFGLKPYELGVAFILISALISQL